MSQLDTILLIMYSVILIVLLSLLIKELLNIRSIKKIFTCEHCNTINNTISNGQKCSNCNRTFKNKQEKWEHYLLFSISEINTKLKKVEFKYEYYHKRCMKELILCISAIVIIVLALLLVIL